MPRHKCPGGHFAGETTMPIRHRLMMPFTGKLEPNIVKEGKRRYLSLMVWIEIYDLC